MENMQVTPELIGEVGVGVVSFMVLVSIVIYLLRAIQPILIQLRVDGENFKSVIDNNTQATNNVATALLTIQSSMDSLNTKVTEQCNRVSLLEKEVQHMHK